MKKELSEEELFEKIPVPQAVATLAIPTIISQVVTMIYNLADTFFVGQIGNPYMVAAVSLVSSWFNLLTALGNLFGLGGGSLISRMLGSSNHRDVKHVSVFSIWGGGLTTLLFSILTFVFRTPLLNFLGASPDTYDYAQSYLNVAGAAIATACSNLASVIFFVVIYIRLKEKTTVSLLPGYFTFRFIRQIFSVGLASALATTLGNVSNMVIVKLAAGYGDIPVAAYGIVKRIDQVPLNVSMGLCQGFMPLVGYNYASGNYRRMRDVSFFSWKTAVVMSACFVACFAFFAHQILHLFIPEMETSTLGASFLRIACLAVPFTSINFLISYTLQAMGKGAQSAILTFSRQGLLNVPLLVLMNVTIGLYGMIWTQLIVELIMLPVSLGMYRHTWQRLKHRDKHKEETI